jgi:DNA-binding FadR family transcriptional regulator
MTINKPKAPRGKTANLHVHIARAIGERILGGEFMPGDLLPNEVEWGKAHGASRTAVREAIKGLSAKGLIISRPKIGSRVEPKSRWNMLDRDVLNWHRSAMDRKAFLLSTQEARKLIEPGIAELAARKHTPEQLDLLLDALEAMRRARNIEEHVAADVAFHERLMACANNELLVPFGIIIEQALGNLFDFTTQRNRDSARVVKLHEEVARAVAVADGAAAKDAMTRLLRDTDAVVSATQPKAVPARKTKG